MFENLQKIAKCLKITEGVQVLCSQLFVTRQDSLSVLRHLPSPCKLTQKPLFYPAPPLGQEKHVFILDFW